MAARRDVKWHSGVAVTSTVGNPVDRLGRALADLRLSVTDRCNFRCSYCMPKEVFGPGFRFLPREQILSFEELARLSRVFVGLGTKKLRLTGGEPLLRTGLPKLIEMLAPLNADLALTTNGSLLADHAEDLKRAGLSRVTVSLDSLDDTVFRAMNDVDFPVAQVLTGIERAAAVGLRVKINCVVRKGVNDHTIGALAEHFRGSGHVLRFIEFMDVGMTNGWRMDQVLSAKQILETLGRQRSLLPVDANYSGEVARRYRYEDGSLELGIIASVTEPFCGACTRARLSAEGKLFTCLFATTGTDLRALLRGGVSDTQLADNVRALWLARSDRYSELRRDGTRSLRKIEMSYIGG